eukprot:s2477_g15.t1
MLLVANSVRFLQTGFDIALGRSGLAGAHQVDNSGEWCRWRRWQWCRTCWTCRTRRTGRHPRHPKYHSKDSKETT